MRRRGPCGLSRRRSQERRRQGRRAARDSSRTVAARVEFVQALRRQLNRSPVQALVLLDRGALWRRAAERGVGQLAQGDPGRILARRER